MSYLHHNRFKRTIRVIGNLKTIGRVHIGSGDYQTTYEKARRSHSAHIRIGVEGEDVPYIPGSSLKGVFRTVVESILVSVGKYTCLIEKESHCKDIENKIKNANMANNYEEINNLLKQFCFACKIFGGPGYASNIFVSDCLPIPKSVGYDTSLGIAINRLDGVAARGAIFSYEHINPNSMFDFHFKSTNLPNYLMGLVFYAIFLINKGIVLIGGKNRAGLGNVNIVINSLEIQTPEERSTISYETIEEGESKLSALHPGDTEIKLNIENPSNLTLENFSDLLINQFRGAWDWYVKNTES